MIVCVFFFHFQFPLGETSGILKKCHNLTMYQHKLECHERLTEWWLFILWMVNIVKNTFWSVIFMFISYIFRINYITRIELRAKIILILFWGLYTMSFFSTLIAEILNHISAVYLKTFLISPNFYTIRSPEIELQ